MNNLLKLFIFINIIDLASFNEGTSNNSFNDKKNLIIGLAYKYSWSEIRNFFISLKKVDFKNCDFVIFVREMSKKTIKKIQSCGVITYKVPKILKIPGFVYRYELYKDFLLENKDKYNMVFTADIRDTIFQKDIFQFYDYNKSFFGVFLEDNNLDDEINKPWVLLFCDEKEFNNELAKKKIICSGTLIGTVDKFIEFSNMFWNTIKDIRQMEKVFDQGVLNYLIYYKKIFNDSLIIKDNHDFLMTIGSTPRNKIILDKEYNILNFNGNIAAVVHQYDRKKDIAKNLNTKFNDINFNHSSFIKVNKNKINTFNQFLRQKWSNYQNNNFYFLPMFVVVVLLVLKINTVKIPKKVK